MRTLVLFVYHQVNERVRGFVERAVFEAPDVDFVFIRNGVTGEGDDVAVPGPGSRSGRAPWRGHVATIARDNVGYDFGGWSDALLRHGYADGDRYDHYVFVNSSVWGPFLGAHPGERWTDVFVRGLSGDVRLFGVTINCALTHVDPLAFAHVQSYLFAVSRATLRELVADGIFSCTEYAATLDEAVRDREVRMSRRVLARGGNLGCLHGHYRGVDWRFRDRRPADYGLTFRGDVMYPPYAHVLWTPDELVFVKAGRRSPAHDARPASGPGEPRVTASAGAAFRRGTGRAARCAPREGRDRRAAGGARAPAGRPPVARP